MIILTLSSSSMRSCSHTNTWPFLNEACLQSSTKRPLIDVQNQSEVLLHIPVYRAYTDLQHPFSTLKTKVTIQRIKILKQIIHSRWESNLSFHILSFHLKKKKILYVEIWDHKNIGNIGNRGILSTSFVTLAFRIFSELFWSL